MVKLFMVVWGVAADGSGAAAIFSARAAGCKNMGLLKMVSVVESGSSAGVLLLNWSGVGLRGQSGLVTWRSG
jgi:hypothetical protein